MEQILQEFKTRIAAASGAQPLQIRGGGSKHWYGQRPTGELLDTGGYSGIVEYEPTELVITARCGTPLSEIDAVLASRRGLAASPPSVAWLPPDCPDRDGSSAARCATSCWALT